MTAQFPDTIIIDNKEYDLPDFVIHNEFVTIDDSHIIKLMGAKLDNFYTSSPEPMNYYPFDRHGMILSSTRCHRKYIATWEIRDKFLYLESIRGLFSTTKTLPFLADWITGTLVVPKGELLGTLGYWPVKEEEFHIKVENGVIQSTTIVDNRVRYADEDFVEELPF